MKGENEGTIDFWWTRREDGQGGQLTIRKTGSTYGYGLNKDAFTFAWQGSFSASSTPKGKIKLMNSLPPGREFVIVDYDARESQRDGEKKPPRRAHLKLMGRFPIQK